MCDIVAQCISEWDDMTKLNTELNSQQPKYNPEYHDTDNEKCSRD